MPFAASQDLSSLVSMQFVLAESTHCLLVSVPHCSFYSYSNNFEYMLPGLGINIPFEAWQVLTEEYLELVL